MNQYVERYIYDVTRRLPENQREDVSRELASIIEDMLEEDSDVAAVLRKLGHPKELASHYREKPRYLISPEYFDRYIDTLRLVLRIVLIVWVVVASIIAVTEIVGAASQSMDFGAIIRFSIQLVFGNLGTAFSMIMSATVIVTIIFAILDYNGASLDEENWSLDDLPMMAKSNTKKISKAEAIFEIVMSLAFMSFFFIMITNHINIPVIINGETVFGIFNLEHFRQCGFIIVIATSLQILIAVLKLTFDRYNYVIAIANLVSNLVGIFAAGLILLSGSPISTEFYAFILTYIPEFNASVVFGIVFALIAVISIINTGVIFYYAGKNTDKFNTYFTL